MPEIGQVAETNRIFTQSDYDRFAALSGDDNPIHVDLEYSAASVWERPVAHGMFLYSCLSALLADTFPGAVQERQEFMFPAPTYTGDEMILTADVIAVDGDTVTVAVRITDPEGTTTCKGETVLRWEAP